MRDDTRRNDASIVARTLDVRKVFADQRAALRDVTLDLAAGRITALVGANGSGKSTLLKLLAGQIAPTSGCVQVFERDPVRHRRQNATSVAYAAQDTALDPEMTGAETLALFAALYRVEYGQALEVACSFGIESHLTRAIATYSGGLRRRLHLAAAMLHEPTLVLLDEPTAGLDPEGSEELWARLEHTAARGSAVLIATHDLLQVERRAHHVAFLEGGAIVASGPPQALIREHAHARLIATLRTPPSAPLRSQLADMPGVTGVRETPRGFMIETALATAHRNELIARVASLPLEITDLNWREPDLAQAWEAVTGRDARALGEPRRMHRR